MQKFFIFIGMTLGSWIGWAVGEHWGMMTATILSGILGCVGIYGGWKAAREWLE